MVERIRAFLAVDVGDALNEAELLSLRERLIKIGELRFVRKDQLHFTIKFFGEIPPSSVEEIKELLSNLRMTPFEVVLLGLGAFPTLSHPRVLWIGVEERAKDLMIDLSRRVEAILSGKVWFDPKPFEPHLTVARVKNIREKNVLLQLINDFRNRIFGKLIINELKLKKSVLTPQGAVYYDLFSLRFMS
jgi:2'-5' RNA ligase